MSSEKEKQPDVWEILGFLGPRLQEILRRCSKVDRRDPLQEFAYLLERYATGRLIDIGDAAPASPRVSLAELPHVTLVERTRARRVRPSDGELDSSPFHEEEPVKSAPRDLLPHPRGGDA